MSRNQHLINGLYRRQVEGTKNLYLNVGYFFRMKFWIWIQKSEQLISAMTTLEQHRELYETVIKLMDKYIETASSSEVDINTMICNRDRIEASFSDNPAGFTESLRECLRRERELLFKYHGLTQDDVVLEAVCREQGGPISSASPIQGDDASLVDSPQETYNHLGHLDIVHGETTKKEDDNSQDSPSMYTDFLNKIDDKISDIRKYKDMRDELYKELEQKGKEGRDFLDLMQLGNMLDDGRLKICEPIHEYKRHYGQEVQAYETSKREVLSLLSKALENLKIMKNKYLCDQALMEVKLMHQNDLPLSTLQTLFETYAKSLSKLVNLIGASDSQLDVILKDYMGIAVVMLEHPDGFTFIESDKKDENEGGKGKMAKGKQCKSKELKSFATKKNSGIKVKLEILGGLLDVVVPKSHSIALKSYSVGLITEDGHKAGELSYPDNVQLENCQLTLTDIKVYNHRRQTSGHTRSQFLRLCITLKIFCFKQDFELQIKSLPFNLGTGSLQSLEFMGTRMWYVYCNMSDMYTNCKMWDELEVAQVMEMLDMRIKSISSQAKRGLSYDSKQFLLKQIPFSKTSNQGQRETISEHCFSKELIGNTDDKGVAERKFSFFQWFYAFVHTIETHLLKPWLNGVIYGLLTREEAKQVLLGDTVPYNTALIRPVRSKVINPNCREALIKIAVEIKICQGGEDVITVIDVDMATIEKCGLYKLLDCVSVTTDDKKTYRILHVLNANNSLMDLEDIKEHPEATETDVPGYHKFIVQRKTQFEIHTLESDLQKCTIDESPNHSPICPTKKRKTSSRLPSVGSSASNCSPSSASFHFDSSAGSRNPEYWSPGDTALASSPIQEQPEHCDAGTVKREPSASPSSVPSPGDNENNWGNFGGTQVNISNLKGLRTLATRNPLAVQGPLVTDLPLGQGMPATNGLGSTITGEAAQDQDLLPQDLNNDAMILEFIAQNEITLNECSNELLLTEPHAMLI